MTEAIREILNAFVGQSAADPTKHLKRIRKKLKDRGTIANFRDGRLLLPGTSFGLGVDEEGKVELLELSSEEVASAVGSRSSRSSSSTSSSRRKRRRAGRKMTPAASLFPPHPEDDLSNKEFAQLVADGLCELLELPEVESDGHYWYSWSVQNLRNAPGESKQPSVRAVSWMMQRISTITLKPEAVALLAPGNENGSWLVGVGPMRIPEAPEGSPAALIRKAQEEEAAAQEYAAVTGKGEEG